MDGGATSLLFLFLTLAALVKVLDDDTDEHVQHKEGDEQQKRDEVEQSPLVIIFLWLQAHNYGLSAYRK